MSLYSRIITTLCCLFCATPAWAGEPLTVISHMPQGQVDSMSQIIVRFSENMRPLGVMEQEGETSPLKLTVPGGQLPPGNYRWLDPATLTYLFDVPLSGPYRIEAEVPTGVTSLAGNSIKKAVRWEITTPPLSLAIQSPSGNSGLPPENASFFLTSNYPLDLDNMRKQASLTGPAGKAVAFTIQEAPGFSYRGYYQHPYYYQIHIKESLGPNQLLTFTLNEGARAQEGSVVAPPLSKTLASYGSLLLSTWRVSPAALGSREKAAPESQLRLDFNNPVRSDNLLAHLSISPAVRLSTAGLPDDDYTSSSFRLPYLWQPQTTYTITIGSGLRDEYGTSLDKPAQIKFTTGDYRPLFSMDQNYVVLEKKLGGLFPYTVRNLNAVDMRLVHFPWSAQNVTLFNASSSWQGGKDYPHLNGSPLHGAAVIDQHLSFARERNVNIRQYLDLSVLLEREGFNPSHGFTHIRASYELPQVDKKDPPSIRHHYAKVQITDLAVNARIGRDNGLVWVTGLDSGEPVAEAEIILLDSKGQPLWQEKSDSQGLALLPGKKNLQSAVFGVQVSKGDDTALLSMHSSSLQSNYWDAVGQSQRDRMWRLHTVSQLPLYQPGQEVQFTVFAKVFDEEQNNEPLPFPQWIPLAEERLEVFVKDNRGKVVHTFTGRTNAFGSLSSSFLLSESANLGEYQIEAKSMAFNSQGYGSAFQVASFRPPDFLVDLTVPDSHPVEQDRKLNASVSASYFSGASMAGAGVELILKQQETHFTPELLAGYATGYTPPMLWYRPAWYGTEPGREIARIKQQLDKDGHTGFTLPAIEIEAGRPQLLELEATVTDAAGLASQGAGSFILHPSASYVGIRAPRFVPSGQETTLRFKAATWDNQPLSQTTVLVQIHKTVNLGNAESRQELVQEETHSLSAEGTHQNITFAASGTYTVTATITDEQGRDNISQVTVYVPGREMEWRRLQPGNTLGLETDTDAYTPGDTATIIINTPFEQALALITVERSGILRHEILPVSGPTPTISLPLCKEDAPYVIVTVTLIKGRTALPPSLESTDGSADDGAPAVAYGEILLELPYPEPDLETSVRSTRTQYRPGEEVQVTVAVSQNNNPLPHTQITLLAVDERVLRAAGEKDTYYPNRSFQVVHSHGVEAGDLRLNLLNLNAPLLNSPAGEIMYAAVADSMIAEPVPPVMAPRARATSAGGNEEVSVRENFSPMAFWLAEGMTDAKGMLNATFTLPDTLTSYRIVAVAADQGSRFATGESTIQTSKPLQLLSALPRFATQGDLLEGRILVQNMGSTAGTVTLRASVTGMELLEEKREIYLEAGASGMVAFPLRIRDVGLGEIQVRGTLGKEQDAARFFLTIKPAMPLTTVAAAGLLRQGERYTLPIALPAPLDERSQLSVILAASPAAGMPLAADAVLGYPWNCLEQRLSRAWVRLMRLQYGDLLGLPLDEQDHKEIALILESTERHSLYDGSLTLWPGMREGSYYLTAYTLLVGLEAEKSGLSLPGDVQDNALRYLLNQLQAQANHKGEDRYNLTSEALSLYVMSRMNREYGAKQYFAGVVEAAEASTATSPMVWGCLLLAADQWNMGDQWKTQIRTNLEKSVAVTPTQLHFAGGKNVLYWTSMGSRLRDNGMVLAALSQSLPDYPRLEALAYWLAQGLGEQKVLSTQEGVYGIWGLASYLESLNSPGDVAIRATWNKEESINGTFRRLTDPPLIWTLPASRLPEGTKTDLELESKNGAPYWTARLTYGSTSLPVQAENAGFTLSRIWNASGPWRMGDVVKVTLTMTVPNTRRHVLLFAPFPAGMEPVRATRVDLQEAARTYQAPWHWEETREDGILLYTEQVQPGIYTYTYELRAAAPGTFVLRPSQVEEMYTPEVFGRTGGEMVVIQPEAANE